jgi:4-amino-4-deoxy-L-arabinose transferase-like glycosyltransferase
LAAAAGKPFWYDELLTLAVGSLGNWSARLTALKLPLDGQPPLFYTIEHFAMGLVRNKLIAMRLPSILAFPCTLVCIFVYVKRRGGDVLAFFCAILLLISNLFQTYAVEARPYSLLVACFAFALVCYQRTPAPFWTLLLAASLALAESLHYLAVLAMVPFGLAEATVLLKTRRIRRPVLAAFAMGSMPLLLQWKLLAINKAYYGPHFWAHFSFSNLPLAYAWLFNAHSPIGGGIAALCLTAIAGTYLWPRGDTMEHLRSADGTAETILVLGLVLLPFLAYLLVTVGMRSGLTLRYVLPTVLGISLAAGFALSRATWKAVALFAIFVLAAAGVQELSFWRSFRLRIEETRSNPTSVENLLNKAGYQELAVAVPNYSIYLPLVYSCAPNVANRLVFLYQIPSSQNQDLPTDTVNKGMVLLQSYWPIRMRSFQEFMAAHPRFLVYVEDKDPGRDWFILRLSQEGWSLQIVALDYYRIVYLVSHDGHFSR